jgi:hypothetical protein
LSCENKESDIKKELSSMKEYQKERPSVKGSLEVLDAELLVELASVGLLALSLQVGLKVFRQMLEADVEAQAGPKGTHKPERATYRHGTERTRVVMGGQKVSVQRPRVRSTEGTSSHYRPCAYFKTKIR